ncbi:MAG TPA: S41 family peptidase [Phycisphaerales bacterium]|nr:S41 family peptidase [Phycisphaerales bacterium]
MHRSFFSVAHIRGCAWAWAGIAAAMMHTVGGCASPARPELDAFSEEIETTAPNGKYIATFHTRWFGPVHARLTAQPTGEGFKANSEPGVAWSLVGGVEQVLGQVFAPFVFPSGMLLVWSSTLPDVEGGKPGEGWIGPATIDPWRLPTQMNSPRGPVIIRYKDGRAIAVMTFERAGLKPLPATDFVKLTDDVQRHVREHYFDPKAADSAQMRAFFDDVRAAAPRAQDDLTYLAAVALAWRKHPDLALSIPFRAPVEETADLLRDVDRPVTPLSLTFSEKTGIATIDAVAFQDAAQVDSLMSELCSRSPAGVVIDLRNCTGLDLSSLRMLSWLVDRPIEAGVVLDASRRGDLLGDEATGVAPALALDSVQAFDAIQPTLDAHGAAALTVHPAQTSYPGKVVLVTSSRTRSSGEVLARLLQSAGRAEIVGERTAGRPRFSRERALEQGFLVRVDELDWRPAGDRSESIKAVRPDHAASRNRALKRAEQLIVESAQSPAPVSSVQAGPALR